MVDCQICGKSFGDGQVQAGMLTRHVRSEHGLSKKQYVIETEYDGDPPSCACGMCNEEPYFNRGEFSDYALEHDTYQWQKERYIELYGRPTCNYIDCQNEVGFKRGKPRRYCSQSCVGKDCGFGDEEVQKKVREVVRDKYGVNNVSKLKQVRGKLSEKNSGKNPWDAVSEEKARQMREKISDAFEQKWNDDQFKKERLEQITNGLNDPSKTSSPHRKIRKYLNLQEIGFVFEERVGNYIVDELHYEDQIIIEINGDYVHANPDFYQSDDIIRLPGSSYTAREKWQADKEKVDSLEKHGYEVLVIWWSEFQDNPDKYNEWLNKNMSE